MELTAWILDTSVAVITAVHIIMQPQWLRVHRLRIIMAAVMEILSIWDIKPTFTRLTRSTKAFQCPTKYVNCASWLYTIDITTFAFSPSKTIKIEILGHQTRSLWSHETRPISRQGEDYFFVNANDLKTTFVSRIFHDATAIDIKMFFLFSQVPVPQPYEVIKHVRMGFSSGKGKRSFKISGSCKVASDMWLA